MNSLYGRYLLLILVGVGLIISCTKLPQPKKPLLTKLPIYRLSIPMVDEGIVQNLALTTLGITGEDVVKVTREKERLRLRLDAKVVEVYTKSGAVWAADQAKLWNPELKPKLPNEEMARKISDEFFKKNKLLPSPGIQHPFSVSFTNMGATYAAILNANKGERKNRKLDVQVNYNVKMHMPRQDGTLLTIPIVGGGGEFNLTLGDEGNIVAYSGLWRPIESTETESPIVPRKMADKQFKQMVSGIKIRSFESFLAYYSAPPSVEQKFLYPVYVYRALAVVDNETVPLRLITIPATEFGPKIKIPKPLTLRTEKDLPKRRSTVPEGIEEREATKGMKKSMLLSASANWREAGISWIGLSGGLAGSQNNAKGFIDELSADGWSINFNWGDAAAWESDWRRNDDDWVDAADFVFYTGHASMNGWVLSNPDDGSLHTSEVGTSPESPGDLWGQQDLEWFIIAACGPLQDEILSPGGGDVFDRWSGSFDGLHQLLGYGAVTYDNEEEGKSIVRYARDGQTIINAWFRTAREIQPSTNGYSAPDGPTIYVGVMYVYRSGSTSPYNDHIWLHGSVAPDPTSPNVYVAMWTST